MSKIKHIFSVIHSTIYGAVCFQFTHSLSMIERIYILCLIIIIKSEVWTITHCLGLGHETMVCAVCFSIFLSKGWLHQITPKGIIKCTCIANIQWGENWVFNHDDVIKWKHFPWYCTFVQGIHQSLENFSHKGQRPEALMFSLICAWINGWVNNREAGSLRRHHDHYDITVIQW